MPAVGRAASSAALALGLALAAVGCGATRSTAPRPAAEPVPAEFQARVAEYVALHRRVAATVPPDTDTHDSAKLRTRRDRLADAIRRARPNPQPGEIFTPAVVPYFRGILKSDFKQRDGQDSSAALEEVPHVDFHINDAYPDREPLATVPPMLLAHLPRLPEELEYRFFARSLILLDAPANLIVDYIPGIVVPAP